MAAKVERYPEIPLDEEFVIQHRKLTGIAGKLGMSEQDALAVLPKKFPDRLPEYDELDINTPLIIPRFRGISWLQLIEAADLEISDYLRGRLGELGDWQDPRGVEIFDKPYAAWFHTGDRYMSRRAVDVRSELHRVEAAGDHWDGAGLAILRPDRAKEGRFFDLIGGQVGFDGLIDAYWFYGRLRFDAYLAEFAVQPQPQYRALVRGSKVEA